MFTVSNENEAWYIEKNVNQFIGGAAAKTYTYGKTIYDLGYNWLRLPFSLCKFFPYDKFRVESCFTS